MTSQADKIKSKSQFKSKTKSKLKSKVRIMSDAQQQEEELEQQQQAPQRRLLCNTFSICVLALALLVLPGCEGVTHVIGDVDLSPIVYSNYSQNITYRSSTEHNPRGMKPLYDITHNILSVFVGPDPLPPGYVTIKDRQIAYGPKVERNEWGDLIKQYWVTLLFVAFIGLLVFAMPIIGLCFCCCRCVGGCGARSEPFDKRHDTCRRFWYGFMLVLLAIGLLFGVIIAFTMNSYVHSGVDKAPTALMDGGADTQRFLEGTSKEVDHLLVQNYKELSDKLKQILNETSSYIILQLEEQSRAISLMYLSDFLSKLPELRAMLVHMKEITSDLRVFASQLSDGLRGVKRDLLVMLTKCNVSACQEVLNKYEIGKLDADGIHYDMLPDVTNIINTIEDLINNNIAQAGFNGRENLKKMRTMLKESIAEVTPEVTASIDNAGKSFENASNQIKSELAQASKEVGSKSQHYNGLADKFVEEYTPYRFYFGIAACVVLLLILLCLVAALMCGICGKRPGGYGDDCCNKGAGSRLLMIAVALIFLSFSAIALIGLLHFLMGLVAYRGFCVPVKDPENDGMFREFDKTVDLNTIFYPELTGSRSHGTLPPFRISHLISSCKGNQSIYEVLRIHNRFDINELKDYHSQYKFSESLDDLVDSMDTDSMKTMTILTEKDKARVLNLSTSALTLFDSGQFVDNLGDTITKYSLTEIAAQLRQTANKITNDDLKDVQISLRNQALHLETYEHNLVIPMKNRSAELIDLAYALDKALRYKDRPFKDSIPLLVDEIMKAQMFINKSGKEFVKNIAQNLTKYFVSQVDGYVNRVMYMVENEIGTCEPLARVYDSSIVAVCSRIVDPLNGFWAGIFWCLLLFLPILCIAILLASLYQKSDPYPGPLVESEYLYDAYSERDHIPLANGPKNKRRKNKEHRRRGEYYEDAAGPAPHGVPQPAAAVRDTRYSDMAPKHWDGGPPRYQNPPMAPPASEYERPPPYYYPGATEQD